MNPRWDETWHRLREWTRNQGPSERLSAQVLLSEGYSSLDPSHPLGGPDGGRDALCQRDGKRVVMAVYFPRGQQRFSVIKQKFLDDLTASSEHTPQELAFVTNQELTLGERQELREAASGLQVELYHLERITAILDKPLMAGVRKQFLDLEFVETWPDPAPEGSTLEQLAHLVEFATSGRVEVLARAAERMIVWLKPPAGPPDSLVRHALLRAACVLSGLSGVSSIEIGLSNTSDLPHSICRDEIGQFRAAFDRAEVLRVATSKELAPGFWANVAALVSSGDNIRVGTIRMPYDDFEAKA